MGEKDKTVPLDEQLLVQGVAAIARGDADGGAEALRLAQEIQKAHQKKNDEKPG